MKRTHLIAAASLALVASIALAGCSVKSSDSSPANPSASSAPRGFAGGGGSGAAPGVSGQVAQIDGSTAQVQSTQSQTAVSWTGSTTFTTQVAATAADVAVGDCIVARPSAASGADRGAASASTVAAATIEITPKTDDGRCAAAAFGGGQGRPGIRPTPAPGGNGANGARDGATPGAGRGFGGAAFGAVGQVTGVANGSYTVAVERFARPGAATPAPGATPQSASETVTFTSDTTFTAVRSANASAVKVGVCVTALGKTDDTGALSATSIAVSPPVDGACASGFGGFGGGRNGTPGSGSTNG